MTTNQPECNAIRDPRKLCSVFGDRPKLYCNCGCMSPTQLHYDITDVIVSDRAAHGYADYTLTRNGVRCGEVNTQYATVVLDRVEYLAVSKTSPMYRLVQEALNANIPQRDVKVTEIMTYSEVEDTTEQDMDDRNTHHPGYCRKCHSYCYGDCKS